MINALAQYINQQTGKESVKLLWEDGKEVPGTKTSVVANINGKSFEGEKDALIQLAAAFSSVSLYGKNAEERKEVSLTPSTRFW
jgi:hypothetical protein